MHVLSQDLFLFSTANSVQFMALIDSFLNFVIIFVFGTTQFNNALRNLQCFKNIHKKYTWACTK